MEAQLCKLCCPNDIRRSGAKDPKQLPSRTHAGDRGVRQILMTRSIISGLGDRQNVQ